MHTQKAIMPCSPITMHIHTDKCIHLHIHGVTGVKASCLPLMGSTGINLFCTTMPEGGDLERKDRENVRSIAAVKTYCRIESWDLESWYLLEILGRNNSLS